MARQQRAFNQPTRHGDVGPMHVLFVYIVDVAPPPRLTRLDDFVAGRQSLSDIMTVRYIK